MQSIQSFDLAAQLFAKVDLKNAKVILYPSDQSLQPYLEYFSDPAFLEILKNHISNLPLQKVSPVFTSINGVMLGSDPQTFVNTVQAIGNMMINNVQIIHINRVIITQQQNEVLTYKPNNDDKLGGFQFLTRDNLANMINNGLEGKALIAFCGQNRDVRNRLCMAEGNVIQGLLWNKYQIRVNGNEALNRYRDIVMGSKRLVTFSRGSEQSLFPEIKFKKLLKLDMIGSSLIALSIDGKLYIISQVIKYNATPGTIIEDSKIIIEELHLNVPPIIDFQQYKQQLYLVCKESKHYLIDVVTDKIEIRTLRNKPNNIKTRNLGFVIDPVEHPEGLKVQSTLDNTWLLYGIINNMLYIFRNEKWDPIGLADVSRILSGCITTNGGPGDKLIIQLITGEINIYRINIYNGNFTTKITNFLNGNEIGPENFINYDNLNTLFFVKNQIYTLAEVNDTLETKIIPLFVVPYEEFGAVLNINRIHSPIDDINYIFVTGSKDPKIMYLFESRNGVWKASPQIKASGHVYMAKIYNLYTEAEATNLHQLADDDDSSDEGVTILSYGLLDY